MAIVYLRAASQRVQDYSPEFASKDASVKIKIGRSGECHEMVRMQSHRLLKGGHLEEEAAGQRLKLSAHDEAGGEVRCKLSRAGTRLQAGYQLRYGFGSPWFVAHREGARGQAAQVQGASKDFKSARKGLALVRVGRVNPAQRFKQGMLGFKECLPERSRRGKGSR